MENNNLDNLAGTFQKIWFYFYYNGQGIVTKLDLWTILIRTRSRNESSWKEMSLVEKWTFLQSGSSEIGEKLNFLKKMGRTRSEEEWAFQQNGRREFGGRVSFSTKWEEWAWRKNWAFKQNGKNEIRGRVSFSTKWENEIGGRVSFSTKRKEWAWRKSEIFNKMGGVRLEENWAF